MCEEVVDRPRATTGGEWDASMGEPGRLSILMTNACLAGRTGTEVMTAELALAMHRRGHDVLVYSPRLGALAQEVRAHGVPVTDRIGVASEAIDVIHGHHNLPLAVAMTRYPTAPALFVCHDSAAIYDQPLVSPRVGAYVAVDSACRRRLLADGVPAAQVHLMPFAVDLSRYTCRTAWAAAPLTALAVTKHRAPWLPAARAACAERGIELSEVGPGVGRSVSDLPERMRAADIVFAWSRSALEAAATGAAVVLIDELGFGGLLTSDVARRYPDHELGRRNLPEMATAAGVGAAIDRYDAVDCAVTERIVRERFSLETMIAGFEGLYHAVMAQPAPEPGAAAASLAAFLETALPRYEQPPELLVTGAALWRRVARMDAWAERAVARGDWVANSGPGLTRVGFDANGPGVAMLAAGWSAPETEGVWSCAPAAEIVLPGSLCRAWGGRLAFECAHYFPMADRPEMVRVVEPCVDGHVLACWTFSRADYGRPGGVRLTLEVPDALMTGEAVAIVFGMAAPVRPLDMGEAPDGRLLGLYLRGVGPALAS